MLEMEEQDRVLHAQLQAANARISELATEQASLDEEAEGLRESLALQLQVMPGLFPVVPMRKARWFSISSTALAENYDRLSFTWQGQFCICLTSLIMGSSWLRHA